jgi:putative aldouronate transport system substrate-binding protein
MEETIMKRFFLLISIGLITGGSLLFAGGKGESSGSGSDAVPGAKVAWYEKYPEPVTVHVGQGNVRWPEGETMDNNPNITALREKYNINVIFDFVLIDGDDTPLILAISSNSLPDITVLPKREYLVQLLDSGGLEDLTGLVEEHGSPYYKDLANERGGIQKAMSTTFRAGRQYALTTMSPSFQDDLFWIREDWRLKLKLPEPKTTQDFVNLAKAFVQNDMAGNKMTAGFELASGIAGGYNGGADMDPYFNELGAYKGLWYEDGRRLIYGSAAPQAKQALAVLRDFYAQGLVPRDFASRDIQASISAGYPGIITGPWWFEDWPLNNTVQNIPNAVWKPYTYAGSKTGKFHTFAENSQTSWVVVRKGYAHPELAVKMQNLGNYLAMQMSGNNNPIYNEKWRFADFVPADLAKSYDRSPPGWSAWPTIIHLAPLEAVLDKGRLYQLNLERYKKGDTNFAENLLREAEHTANWESGKDTSYIAWQDYMRYWGLNQQIEAAKNMDKKAIYYPETTPTMEMRWANLQDLETLAYTKIIMGDEPLDYFDTFVKQWNDQGGAKITEEVNAQYRQ